MSIDGNFHLQRNNKGLKKDSPLTGNAGFWVDDGELEDYIDGKGARVEEHERVRKISNPLTYYGRWEKYPIKKISTVTGGKVQLPQL